MCGWLPVGVDWGPWTPDDEGVGEEGDEAGEKEKSNCREVRSGVENWASSGALVSGVAGPVLGGCGGVFARGVRARCT